MALLQVSKQVYGEAMPVFFQTNSFNFLIDEEELEMLDMPESSLEIDDYAEFYYDSIDSDMLSYMLE